MEFSQVLYMCRQTEYICPSKLHGLKLGTKEIEYVKHIEVLPGSMGFGIIERGRTKVIPDVADQETIAGRSTGFEISVSRRWTLPIASPSCTSDALWGSQGKSVGTNKDVFQYRYLSVLVFAFVVIRLVPRWSLWGGGIRTTHLNLVSGQR